jgi:hypothetical protein
MILPGESFDDTTVSSIRKFACPPVRLVSHGPRSQMKSSAMIHVNKLPCADSTVVVKYEAD